LGKLTQWPLSEGTGGSRKKAASPLILPIPSYPGGIHLLIYVYGVSIMGGLGMQEMIIVLVIALIVFGPKKLPELGKSLGKGIAEFKKASSELAKTWQEEADAEKEPEAPPADKSTT
jgi:TatA/E family protein of Tat protein translocase